MTDTKHSAELPPLPAPLYLGGDEAYGDIVYGYCADQMHAYARAAIAAAAPAGEPVAYCAPNAKGLPEFGKGWMFSPVPQLMATMPLYAAPVPAAAPKAALTDAEMLAMWEIVREGGNFHSMAIPTDTAIISYGRAIESASGPNAALVTTLQKALIAMTSTVFPDDNEIVIAVRAALVAAGFEVKS